MNDSSLPCDKRYRSSQYFLEDQLRCSEALQDFNSVKQLIGKTQSFSLKEAFRFRAAAQATVPVRND